MRERDTARIRAFSGGDADCAMCPSQHRCWGDMLLPGDLVRARREPRLERGAELFHQGERARAIFLVVGGCLILRQNLPDGAAKVTGFRLAGEVAGIEGWARGTHAHTAEAASPTYVCRLSRPRRGAEPASGRRLELLLLKCAMQLDRAATPWAGLPAVTRVAAFIEDFADRVQVKGAAGAHFRLPMSRADIGSYLGLAEETVVRALGTLSREGRLKVQGRTVHIDAVDAQQPATVRPAPGRSPS